LFRADVGRDGNHPGLPRVASVLLDREAAKHPTLAVANRIEELSPGSMPACRTTPLVTVVSPDAKLNICCSLAGRPEYQWGDLQTERFKELWGCQRHQDILAKLAEAPCPATCRMIGYNKAIQAVKEDSIHQNIL